MSLEYNYIVQNKTKQEAVVVTPDDKPNETVEKVIATVSISFDNPAYVPEHEEQVSSPVMQYEDNGEIKRDDEGEPIYTDEEQTRVVPAQGSKQLNFVQDIFVTANAKEQDQEVKSYCESYKKDYIAQYEQLHPKE